MTETLEVTTELALHWAVHRSKRCVPVVGSAERPTPWDVQHREVDRLLDRMLEVSDGCRS